MTGPVRSLALLLGVAIVVANLALAAPTAGPPREPATVLEVVDGDTIRVWLRDGRVETVRLIGLDTPETRHPYRLVECFGREASAKVAALLADRRVTLEADPSQGEWDRYGRLLRYVWLPDGRNFAEVMIAEGFGFEFTYRFPYRYQDTFTAAQRAAREAERGLWHPAACAGGAIQPPSAADASPPPFGPAAPGRSGAGAPADVGAAYPCQPGQIKANRNSGIYHVPGGAFYARTYANVACFDGEADAAAAGFRRARR